MSFNKYQEILESLLNPLNNHFKRDFTQIKWGNRKVVYPTNIVGIEGIARVLWGLTPYFANEQIKKSLQMKKLLKNIIKGIKNGTNPEHIYYWGKIGNFDQRYVEMAALAYFMLCNKKIVEQNFDQQQKENLQNWLLQINQADFSKNNWQFFKVLVNLALQKLDLSYSKVALNQAFEYIDKAYIGKGWYFDGRPGQRDYYIAFGYHFYGLIYCQFSDLTQRKKIFLARAKLFLKDFLNFYDTKGRSVPYGRSLIYRFAPLGFLSYALIMNLNSQLKSQIKWVIEKNLHYWLTKCQIKDDEGKLNLGYCYENDNFLEEYNSDVSVNWALKAFAFLQIKKNDDFWNIKATEMVKQALVILQAPKFAIYHQKDSQTLINSGQWAKFNPRYNIEKYTKFLYNSKYGFCVNATAQKYNLLNADNQLVFEKDQKFVLPTEVKMGKVSKEKVTSHYHYGDDFEVVTLQNPVGNYIKREHIITSKVKAWGYDASFSYPTNKATWKKFLEPQKCQSKKFYSTSKHLLVYKQANTFKANLVHPFTLMYYVKFPIEIGVNKICFYIKI